jgi:hypothetical protein
LLTDFETNIKDIYILAIVLNKKQAIDERRPIEAVWYRWDDGRSLAQTLTGTLLNISQDIGLILLNFRYRISNLRWVWAEAENEEHFTGNTLQEKTIQCI